MRHAFRFRHLAAVAAVVVPLAIGATRARADVVPDKRPKDPPCTAAGQPCLALIERPFDQVPGTCVATTCTREVRMRDGSTTPVGVPCFECQPLPKGSPPPKSKSSGCAVAPDPGDTGPLMVTLSLIAAFLLSSPLPRKGERPPSRRLGG